MVLIDATVCQILLKQKCDGSTEGRTDGQTEGIPIVPLFAPQMAGDNYNTGNIKYLNLDISLVSKTCNYVSE